MNDFDVVVLVAAVLRHKHDTNSSNHHEIVCLWQTRDLLSLADIFGIFSFLPLPVGGLETKTTVLNVSEFPVRCSCFE